MVAELRTSPRDWLLAVVLAGASLAATADGPRFVAEAYPSDVLASKQVYQQQLAASGTSVQNVPFYLIVPKLQ